MAEASNRKKDIFLKALDLSSPDERTAFVAKECGSDDSLRLQVEAMLQAHAAPDSFLEKPAAALELTIDAAPGRQELGVSTESLGTRIGPYKLLQQLGEGGMGVVFMAEQEEPVRRMVALKIIKQGMDSAQVVARFESERQALALMDHPNIARVLDAGTTDAGRPYFVMELIKGIPITKFCDQEHLTPRQRLQLFIPVCQAVQHAHQKGIIHRDLKPSNVMIALYDGKPVPKVIDFGVAKATIQKLTDRTLFTEVGGIVGTLEYMAPEQAELNNLDIDTRADIYALGVLLYELLTGSPPFSAKELRSKAFTEMLRIIREVEPPRPSTKLSSSQELPAIAASRKLEPNKLTSQVQGDLDWIVMKCLEKERSRRYETANAVVQDIQRYLTDEPVLAGPPSAGYRLRKFVKRNRGMVTAASVVLLTLVAGIAGTTWGLVDALDQRDKTEQARKDEGDALKLAEIRRGEAEKVAEENKLLATEADNRREQAETLAVRVEFEHYFSKVGDRSNEALVGMASLLPKAARLKDPALPDLLRLEIGAWSERAAGLNAIFVLPDDLRELGNDLHSYYALAWSGDRKTVLTVRADNTARQWEIAKGKWIGPPLQLRGAINDLALSADGKIALTGSRDKTAQVWDLETGKPIGPPLQHQGQVRAVALSADGKTALTGSDDKTARLWETTTGKPIGPPLQHQEEVRAVALSADGKTALTGSYDKTARLWETTTAKPIGKPLEHSGPVEAVAISANGRTALTGSTDRARLWETATGEPIGQLLQQQRRAWAVALSHDGRTAVTASDDGTAQLWETATGAPIGPPLRHREAVIHVALSADGKSAFTGCREKLLRVWKIATSRPFVPPRQHQRLVFKLALSADGKKALIGSDDNTARLWEMATDKPIGPPLRHQGLISAVALSADGKMGLTGSFDKTARLWDAATGKSIGPPVHHDDVVFAVALSADGKTALTASLDHTERLWDTTSGNPIGPPRQGRDAVVAVALSADGKTALALIDDRKCRLLETATRKLIAPPLQLQGAFAVVVLSADGRTALTGASAGNRGTSARVWNAITGKPIGPPLQHQGAVVALALSADGKTALTGSHDNTARFWETATGKAIGPPLQHHDKVMAVALSGDGKTALTGAGNTSRLWHLPQPLRGDPERIMLWTQVITGLEVDELTAVRVLDAKTWQERRDRLQKLGGPPVP
jgi:eukaryotic-like serine/threonine-protein kinase